jgi:hypothetical protein
VTDGRHPTLSAQYRPARRCRRRCTPPTPVVPAGAVVDLQDEPEHGGFSLGGELALPRVAAGLRIKWVAPNTTIGLLVDVLGPALADRPPMPSFDLRPLDLDARVGLQDLAVLGMCERPGWGPLYLGPNMLALLPFRDGSDGSGTPHHLTGGASVERLGAA